MRVKGRDLIRLSQRQLHFGSERSKVRSGNVAVLILDPMEMLDQATAPTGLVGEKRAPFPQGRRIDLTTLRGPWRAATATPRIDLARLCPLACDAHLKISSSRREKRA